VGVVVNVAEDVGSGVLVGVGTSVLLGIGVLVLTGLAAEVWAIAVWMAPGSTEAELQAFTKRTTANNQEDFFILLPNIT
jgi:hypothetical protein